MCSRHSVSIRFNDDGINLLFAASAHASASGDKKLSESQYLALSGTYLAICDMPYLLPSLSDAVKPTFFFVTQQKNTAVIRNRYVADTANCTIHHDRFARRQAVFQNY